MIQKQQAEEVQNMPQEGIQELLRGQLQDMVLKNILRDITKV